MLEGERGKRGEVLGAFVKAVIHPHDVLKSFLSSKELDSEAGGLNL